MSAFFSVTFILACDTSAASAAPSALWPVLVARQMLAIATGEASISFGSGAEPPANGSSSPRKSSSSPSARSPRSASGSLSTGTAPQAAAGPPGALAGIATGRGGGLAGAKSSHSGRGDARVAPVNGGLDSQTDHHDDFHPMSHHQDGTYATASANAASTARGNATSARGIGAPSDIMMTAHKIPGSGAGSTTGSGFVTPLQPAGPAGPFGGSPAEPEQLLQSARRIFDEHNRDGSLNASSGAAAAGSASPRRKGPPGSIMMTVGGTGAAIGPASGDPAGPLDGGLPGPGSMLFTPSARAGRLGAHPAVSGVTAAAPFVQGFGVDDGRFLEGDALNRTAGTGTGSFRLTGESVLNGLPQQQQRNDRHHDHQDHRDAWGGGSGSLTASPSAAAADALLLRPRRVGPSPQPQGHASDPPMRGGRQRPAGRRSLSPVGTLTGGHAPGPLASPGPAIPSASGYGYSSTSPPPAASPSAARGSIPGYMRARGGAGRS